ncbi:MAG: hypothetical protein H0V47_11535 [Chloroflexia bacterium]|nr:hypothetical protein [Chloroflexia bacterium]
MTTRRLRTAPFIATVFASAAALLVGVAAISAQGTATPEALPRAEGSYPAHIHTGTCDELGEVVYPLTEVSGVLISPGASPVATQVVNVAASPPVGTDEVAAQSITDVDVALEDILADDHAINVHESVENIQNYIACGDVTGEVEDGELAIELQELNDSGITGGALLTDNGDGTTTVTVTLVDVNDAEAMGTPES